MPFIWGFILHYFFIFSDESVENQIGREFGAKRGLLKTKWNMNVWEVGRLGVGGRRRGVESFNAIVYNLLTSSRLCKIYSYCLEINNRRLNLNQVFISS